jgi:LPXTG-motif cell wall-anchored protein
MRTRLRLGAAGAVGLGALLLATVLASPALAWHSSVSVEATCLDSGKIGVHYNVTAWEEGHDATVYVFFKLDDGTVGKLPTGTFDKDHNAFEGDFELPGDTTGMVTVVAIAKWDGSEKSKDKGSTELPEKCGGGHESSTSTSESTTSTSESTTSTTTIEETTTTAAVGAATSTTAGGGQLPFTGASSGPMLLAGIVLIGGGGLFLLLSRSRDGHATK